VPMSSNAIRRAGGLTPAQANPRAARSSATRSGERRGARLARARLALAALAAVLLAPAAARPATLVASPSDRASYEALTLANGLEVLLVSDPETDKAAASLAVHVGSGSDPTDRPGLAHFLEHMLFLGTEKYPQPGEYQAFVNAHGGNHNAYTSYEFTNYFFDVDPNHLEPALDRFAQFFIAPLFTPEYVTRERLAVDSEHRARLNNDGRRRLYAQKQLMNPLHPYSRFTAGDAETLADRAGNPVRDDLIEFYREHYSADLMALVVLGREPLATLREWAVERFSAVPDRDASPLEAGVPLFPPGRLPVRVEVEPIKETRVLELTFPMPPSREHYRAKPAFHIAHLLGHEGSGSVLSALKDRGWAERLSAGPALDTDTESLFDITIELTEAGLGHVAEVIEYLFRYLELVRERGVERWMFEENRTLAEIGFRFEERRAPIAHVRELATALHVYPAQDVIRGPHAFDVFDPALIRRFLDRLRPDNVLVTVMAPGIEGEAVEPWYGAPYRVRAIDESALARWASPAPAAPELALPAPNPFVPEDLALEPPTDATSKPLRVRESPGLDLWHRQDTSFGTPRADFFFTVLSPLASASARHAVLTALYVELVNDTLNEALYPATLAGLGYRIHAHLRGVSVRISGFDDKQRLLLERVLAHLVDPRFDPERFALAKARLARELANRRHDPPWRQLLSEAREVLIRPSYGDEARMTALEPLELADLEAFVPELLARVSVVALAHGNRRREEAAALSRLLEKHLLERAETTEVADPQVVKLPAGVPLVRELDIEHHDSAFVAHFQGGARSHAARARMALLAQVLESPFFHALRTREQLGYVVFASGSNFFEVPAINLVIESPRADPILLEQRTEAFLERYAGELEAMDETEFERHKAALLTRILEDDQTLNERTEYYWRQIDRRRYGFDERERLAAAVRAIAKPAFARFYRQALLGPGHRRVVLRSVGAEHRAAFAAAAAERDDVLIADLERFKASVEYFPEPCPPVPVARAAGPPTVPVAGAPAPALAR